MSTSRFGVKTSRQEGHFRCAASACPQRFDSLTLLSAYAKYGATWIPENSRTSEIETPVFHFDDAASSPGPSRSGCLNRDVALGRYSLGSSATAPIAMTPRGPSPSVHQMYAWAPIRISSRHCGVDQYMYWLLCATSEFIPALSCHFRGFPCHMKPSALNLWPNICHSVPAVTASCRALQYDHATPPSTAAPSPRCDPPLARSCPPTHPPPAAGRAGS